MRRKIVKLMIKDSYKKTYSPGGECLYNNHKGVDAVLQYALDVYHLEILQNWDNCKYLIDVMDKGSIK